jgi:hypothetical protein
MEKDFYKSFSQWAETSARPNATMLSWPARGPAKTCHTRAASRPDYNWAGLWARHQRVAHSSTRLRVHDRDLVQPAGSDEGPNGDKVYTGGFLIPRRTRPAIRERPSCIA